MWWYGLYAASDDAEDTFTKATKHALNAVGGTRTKWPVKAEKEFTAKVPARLVQHCGGPLCRPRPRSAAPGYGTAARPASGTRIRSSERTNGTRPRSACALLRGSEAGLVDAHRHDFLQRNEDRKVFGEVHSLTRETYQNRDFLTSFDPLSDSHLADLRSFHNKEARRKHPYRPATASSGSSSPKSAAASRRYVSKSDLTWEGLSATERLAKLAIILDADIRTGGRALEQMAELQSGKDRRAQPTFSNMLRWVINTPDGRLKLTEGEAGSHGQKAAGNSRSKAQASARPPANSGPVASGPEGGLAVEIPRLLEFMLQNWGTLRDTFSALDHGHHGKISIGEWEGGLSAKGFVGPLREIFHFMDDDRSGMISLTEFKILEPFLHGLLFDVESRRRILADAVRSGHVAPSSSASGRRIAASKGTVDLGRQEHEPASTSAPDVSALREQKKRQSEVRSRLKEDGGVSTDFQNLFTTNASYGGITEEAFAKKERMCLASL